MAWAVAYFSPSVYQSLHDKVSFQSTSFLCIYLLYNLIWMIYEENSNYAIRIFVILSCDKMMTEKQLPSPFPIKRNWNKPSMRTILPEKAASHSPLPAHGLLLSMKAPLPARTKHHHRNGFQLIPQAVIRQEATRSVFH